MGGSNSKLLFASSMKKIKDCKDIAELDDSFWDNQIWSFPIPLEDMFSMLSAEDIRAIRDADQDKIFLLLKKLVSKVEYFFTVTMVSLGGHSNLDGADTVTGTIEPLPKDIVRQVLNCVRLLTRILPFCFEKEELSERIAKLFCLKEQQDAGVPGAHSLAAGSAGQHIMADQTPWKGFTNALIDLLFIPGLTLPAAFAERSRIFYIVWESGIGSDHPIESYQEISLNRHDVLRLLLVLLSYQMYLPAKSDKIASKSMSSKDGAPINPFAFTIVSTLPEPVALALLCSLLNMVVKYDPIGWGLPYNYYLFPDEDEALFSTAVQLINALLDYDPQRFFQNLSDASTSTTQDSQDMPGASFGEIEPVNSHWITAILNHDLKSYTNIFRYYISKLYRKEDFQMLWTGLLRLIMNPIQANKTYLPGSSPQIKVFAEILVLFWRLIQFNPGFFKYILGNDDNHLMNMMGGSGSEQVLSPPYLLTDLVVALAHYATDQEFNLSSDGLVHLCCFILLHLSGEREFSVRLNNPYQTTFSSPHFEGTFADYLISCFLKIINKARQRFYTIAECVMMTIVNMSPFIKSLSAITCNKVVTFLERCIQPTLLYSATLSMNPFVKICTLLGEALGYLLQYQYDTNSQLVYTLLRKRQIFSTLGNFKFSDYQAILQTMQKQSNSSFYTPLDSAQFEQINHEARVTMKLVLDVLDVLGPEISKLCPEDENDACDDQVILDYLQRRTLVGLIPLPRPISIRKFRMSSEISLWLTSFLYGIIYLHNSFPAIWYGTEVKLFTVKTLASST
jgi:hypothetical protein